MIVERNGLLIDVPEEQTNYRVKDAIAAIQAKHDAIPVAVREAWFIQRFRSFPLASQDHILALLAEMLRRRGGSPLRAFSRDERLDQIGDVFTSNGCELEVYT